MTTRGHVNKSVWSLTSAETKEWLANASAEEIAIALDFGRETAREFTRRLSVAQPQPLVTPTVLGQIGEQHVEEILREKFPSTINTSKASHRGDISLLIEHRKVIVEVKNYTNAVPTLGVEKFQRDLVTGGAAAGVFVSLRTPITSVTDSFVIRREYAEGRSVPCAYLVSEDSAAIVLAVNMVTQLVAAHTQSQTELYSRDNILGGVHGISEVLSDMARSRNQLHVSMGDAMTQIFKATAGLAAHEESARKITDTLKRELFHTEIAVGGTESPCAGSQWYAKYSTITREHIAKLVAIIESNANELIPASWKLSGTRCMHGSGIGFHMYSGRVEVVVPRSRITIDIMHLQISTTPSHVSVVLDANSYDAIAQIVC